MPGATTVDPQRPATDIVSETGLAVQLDGDELVGTARVVPQLLVPGTGVLRTSVLGAWTDVLTGLLAMGSVEPGRVPVTLDLAVDVLAPVAGARTVEGRCRVAKAGRGVVVLEVSFTADGGTVPVALGTGSFVASPDARHTLPPLTDLVALMAARPSGPLALPYAERAECVRKEPGLAVMPRREDGLNATRTVNGALLALAVEEAALSAAPAGATLAALALRYLRPVRTGPVVATAEPHGGFCRVEVRDDGEGARLAVLATTRTA